MLTLLDVLRKTTGFLAAKKITGARREAELLLAAVLKCARLDLYLQFERPLPEETLETLRQWLRRRAAREPLQYITGDTNFCKLRLKCDPRALIPRPETEELVELVEKEAARLSTAPARAADLGTGSGCIALALAGSKVFAGTEILATDISSDALALARENAAAAGLDGRVKFAAGDWFDAVPAPFAPIDVVVANPPYLTDDELASAEPEVAAHEPRGALVAGADGLSDLRDLLEQARPRLRAGGFIALETGIAHADALAAAADALGYARRAALPDLSDRQRFFLAWA